MLGKFLLHLSIFILILEGTSCSSKDSMKIIELDGFPSSNEFVDRYLKSPNPLKMKGAAEESPAFVLWEDNEYLMALKGPTTQSRILNTEYFRTDGPLDYFFTSLYNDDDVFEKFVEEYAKKDLTLATVLPSHLRKDVLLPCSIQCADIWNEALIDAFLWMSNEQLITKIHTDLGGNFICTFRGELKFKIFDDVAWKNLPPKTTDNTILNLFPKTVYLNRGKSYNVVVPRGDCLYIPADTAYHVQSSTDTVAVSVLFDSSVPNSINSASCNRKCNTDLTLKNVQFRQYYIIEREIQSSKEYFMSLLTEGPESPRHYLEARLQDQAKFDIFNSVNGEMLRTVAKMAVDLIDKNSDGDIDEEEHSSMTKYEWIQFGRKLSELLDVLEYYNSTPSGAHQHSEL